MPEDLKQTDKSNIKQGRKTEIWKHPPKMALT